MQYWFFGLPGSGKTYLGERFAEITNFPRYEGDDFHTKKDRELIAKGAFGLEHRYAQLKRIHDELERKGERNSIVTHPLPDRNSRARLYEMGCKLVYVRAPLPLVKIRLSERKGHHFGIAQIDAWIPQHWHEPTDEDCLIIDNDGSGNVRKKLEELREP